MNPFISVIRYTKKGFDLEKQVSALFHVPALLSFTSQNFLHASIVCCLHRYPLTWHIAYIKTRFTWTLFFLILNRNSKDV